MSGTEWRTILRGIDHVAFCVGRLAPASDQHARHHILGKGVGLPARRPGRQWKSAGKNTAETDPVASRLDGHTDAGDSDYRVEATRQWCQASSPTRCCTVCRDNGTLAGEAGRSTYTRLPLLTRARTSGAAPTVCAAISRYIAATSSMVRLPSGLYQVVIA